MCRNVESVDSFRFLKRCSVVCVLQIILDDFIVCCIQHGWQPCFRTSNVANFGLNYRFWTTMVRPLGNSFPPHHSSPIGIPWVGPLFNSGQLKVFLGSPTKNVKKNHKNHGVSGWVFRRFHVKNYLGGDFFSSERKHRYPAMTIRRVVSFKAITRSLPWSPVPWTKGVRHTAPKRQEIKSSIWRNTTKKYPKRMVAGDVRTNNKMIKNFR